MNLPIVYSPGGELLIADSASGELVAIREATDHVLADVAFQIARQDAETLRVKRALAFEIRERVGVGSSQVGGFSLKVTESTSWPTGATTAALERLVGEGRINEADAVRCIPHVPKPSGTQLRALLNRLMVKDPTAAALLAAACTTSPPSVRDIRQVAVDEAAA